MAALLAIAIALILYGTLSPFQFDFTRAHGNPFFTLLHTWPARFDRFAVRDGALNIAMLLPLGAVAYLAIARRLGRAMSLLGAVALGCALSASIEMLQLYDAHRHCNAADWLCNTAGAFFGAALGLIYERRIVALAAPAAKRSAPGGVLLAACWMGSQLYPLIPLLSRWHLRAAWLNLIRSPVSWTEVAAGACGWFVFALALRAIWGKLPAGWLALCMFAIPLRLLIADRTVTKSDILAAAVALLLWSAIAEHVRERAGWVLAAGAILIHELAPLHFGGPPHGFSWLPLGATIAAGPVSSVIVVLRKAFEYGAMVWLLRAARLGYLTAGVAVASALAIMEAMQSFMPGRHAEITDSLLALLMALVLWLLD